MSFMQLPKGWLCQFLDEDLQTALPKKVTVRSIGKLYEMAERGGYGMKLEGRQAMENAISVGRGGIWLELSPEQYGKLHNR